MILIKSNIIANDLWNILDTKCSKEGKKCKPFNFLAINKRNYGIYLESYKII
jgi:hypothetical protein